MASKKPAKAPKPAMPDSLVLEVRKKFAEGEGAENENRQNMADDLRFTYEPGYQWDTTAKGKRQGRPCYTFNRVIGAVNQAIGEQRQVRPSGKVRAVSKDAAASTAEVYGGLMRNIEAVSRAENIYDNQFKYAIAGGYGAWIVEPYYCDSESFDQEIRIREVANPFNCMWDPTATDPCRRDAWWSTVAERISREQYAEEWPDFNPANFQAARDSRGWFDSKEVRIAEFYKKIRRYKTIALLSDGRVVEYDKDFKQIEGELAEMRETGMPAPTVENKRRVEIYSVQWVKVDGANILEGPIEYDWNFIPVIRLPGRFVNIEGKQILQSLIRHSKDPQRTYNYHRSTMVETAALTPRAPYLVTSKMIKGREDQWNTLNAVNRPYLEYDIDETAAKAGVAGGRPVREPPPEVPAALMALAAQDAEDIRQTTGYINPALDNPMAQGPESGIALGKRVAASESGAYEFLDNLGKAIQLTWDVCLDMIPTVYDTARIVRTLGVDGVEEFVRVNELDPKDNKSIVNELKKGRYECTVTLGPAFATQRLESLATLLEAAEKVPLIGQSCPDLIAKNLDVKDGEELHKRVRQALIRGGQIVPNERDLKDMPPPPPPDPVQTAMVERLQAQSARDAASAQKTQVEAAGALVEADKKGAELQAIIDEAVGQRLDNLLKAGQLGIGPGGVIAIQKSVERDASTPL